MKFERRLVLCTLAILLMFPPVFPASAQETNKGLGNVSNLQKLSVFDQNQFPPLELRVLKVEGEPLMVPPDAKKWKPVKPGAVLPEKTRVVTGPEETIKLEIPGVSFIEVDTGTEIVLEELVRRKQTRIDRSGLLMNARKEVVNEVELKTEFGDVSNSLRDNNKMRNQYKLKTPTAVAGVRGTSFACSVSGGQTKCSVLEGEVNFSSRDDPSLSLLLGEGLSSKFKADATKPDTTEFIAPGIKEQLQQTRVQAKEELLLEPHVGEFEIENQTFEKVDADTYRSEVDYYRPRNLTLRGTANAREPGAALRDLNARLQDAPLNVQGLNRWRVNLKPDTLAPGRERTLSISMNAIDDSGTKSYPKNLRVNLQHPDVEDVLPENYSSGTVNVNLTRIGSKSVENVRFPYHVFRDDRKQTGSPTLRLSGRATGPGSIQGVAYSLNRGITWEKASGTSRWTIDMPLASVPRKQYTPEVVSWTDQEIIGSVQSLNTFIYHNQPMTRHLRTRFLEYWERFSLKDRDALSSMMLSDFTYRDPISRRSLEQDLYLDRLRKLFFNTGDFRVFHEIEDVSYDNGSGNIAFNIEIQGQHKPTDEMFKIVGNPAQFHFSRGSSGRMKLSEISDMPLNLYLFNPTPKSVSNNQGIKFRTLELVSRTNGDAWFEAPTDVRGDSWVVRTQSNRQEGGVFALSTNDIGNVFPVPERTSGLYQSAARIKEERIYVINTLTEDGNEIVGLLQATDITDESFNLNAMTSRQY